MIEKFKSFLRDSHIIYNDGKSNNTVVIRTEAENALLTSIVIDVADKNIMICQTVLPYKIPKEQIESVSNMILENNNRLLLSTILFDKYSNSTSIKTVLLYEENTNNENLFRRFLFTNISQADSVYVKILKKVYSKGPLNSINLN